MRKVLIGFICCFFCAVIVTAQEKTDTAFQRLYQHYYQLFSSNQKDEFYKTSSEIQRHYRSNGDLVTYYKMRQNEIFFDTQHGEIYKAIKKAAEMLEDMKNDQVNHYELVYTTLGAIFESRGNYRMAEHYYQEAINYVSPKDTAELIHSYAQMTSLKVSREPDKAWEWNERMGVITPDNSPFRKVYLVLKAEIFFFKNEKNHFLKVKKEYDDCIRQYPSQNIYGLEMMNVMQKVYEGEPQEALRLLEGDIPDLTEIGRLDYRIQIYKMTGQQDLALQEVNRRMNLRDSLNSNMLFNNINEINAEVGIAKINEKAAKERELWLVLVIVLLMVALGLIISRYLVRRRYQKRILKQNDQLEIALSEAKESDRMKSLFIEHVSHEIRTPLNVITGYAQIITNPDFHLKDEERIRIVDAIGKNTTSITNIVNDLLEMAQDESKERYRREDTIVVNTLCRQIMEEAKNKNDGGQELNFCTRLPDDFSIQSNQSGISIILRQVIANALKFTKEGQVELLVSESPEHDSVRMIVTDTGVGIPKDLQEKVFERFYKVDSFIQGFGLGLPLSRRIALQLGGTLVIDKDYEEGTRVVFTVPVK